MLEIIALTLEEAVNLEKWGASQIELISGFAEGGLTPSYGLVNKIIKAVDFPVNVMIRPHSRNFYYSDYDLDVMKEDVKTMDNLGVKTVVIGALDSNGFPNLKALEYILKDTNLEITFHRAFDESSNLLKSLDILKSYNRVKTILTSGGKGKASDNLLLLKKIIENRGNIEILIGSGVGLHNMEVFESLNNTNFHIGTAVRNDYYNNEINKEELLQIIKKYTNMRE